MAEKEESLGGAISRTEREALEAAAEEEEEEAGEGLCCRLMLTTLCLWPEASVSRGSSWRLRPYTARASTSVMESIAACTHTNTHTPGVNQSHSNTI